MARARNWFLAMPLAVAGSLLFGQADVRATAAFGAAGDNKAPQTEHLLNGNDRVGSRPDNARA